MYRTIFFLVVSFTASTGYLFVDKILWSIITVLLKNAETSSLDGLLTAAYRWVYETEEPV
jgi:hypothetical protein